jgi:hypothetical protein
LAGHDIVGSSSLAATGGPKSSEGGKSEGNQQQDESYISRLMRGSKSVPARINKRSTDRGDYERDCLNLKQKLDKVMKEDLILFNNDEDRVQGLSGVYFNAFEEDPFSEDSQGGPAKGDAKLENQQLGLVRCTNPIMHEEIVEVWEEKNLEKVKIALDDAYKMEREDGIEFHITEAQRLPMTRFSERIQNQIIKKMDGVELHGRKRSF